MGWFCLTERGVRWLGVVKTVVTLLVEEEPGNLLTYSFSRTLFGISITQSATHAFDTFHLKNGLKRGGALSPLLFNYAKEQG